MEVDDNEIDESKASECSHLNVKFSISQAPEQPSTHVRGGSEREDEKQKRSRLGVMRCTLVLARLASVMKLARRLHEVGYRTGSGEKVDVRGSKREQLRETERCHKDDRDGKS